MVYQLEKILFSKTHLSKMIQSGEILVNLIAGIPQLVYLEGKKY